MRNSVARNARHSPGFRAHIRSRALRTLGGPIPAQGFTPSAQKDALGHSVACGTASPPLSRTRQSTGGRPPWFAEARIPPRTLGFTSPMPREKVCAYSGDWHLRSGEPSPSAEAPLPFAVSHAIAVPFVMVFGNCAEWIMPLFDRGTRLVCVEAPIRGCIGRIPRHIPGSANSALCGACPRRGRQSEWGS